MAGDAPFWLVLGQSHNDGWRAEVTAVQGPAGRTPRPAPALGRPKLIDGFANGWLVRAPQGATALDLRMTWTPQRRVWAALAGSGLAVLVCLVLVARRRRGVPAPGAVPGPGAAPAWAPGLPGAPRPPARRRVAAVAAAVALGSLVVAPWAGVVSAVAVFAALRWPRARTALALAPAALLSVAALYMAQLQLRYGFPLKLSWPDNFEAVTPVAWLAVLTLAAGVLVELALTRERSSGRRPG